MAQHNLEDETARWSRPIATPRIGTDSPAYSTHWTPTPGHTRDHISVVVEDQATTFFLAGDASYDERLMLAGRLDGVSADDDVAGATLGAIRSLAADRPTVYLPTHDPGSAERLSSCRPAK